MKSNVFVLPFLISRELGNDFLSAENQIISFFFINFVKKYLRSRSSLE